MLLLLNKADSLTQSASQLLGVIICRLLYLVKYLCFNLNVIVAIDFSLDEEEIDIESDGYIICVFISF